MTENSDSKVLTEDKETRTSSSVLGMPVYSISEGLPLGQVKAILLDGQDRALLAFVLERRRFGRDERLLPFSAVRSFGQDTLTVDSHAVLERKGQSQQYMRALRQPLPLIGSRVFTDSGRTLGKVEEYRFQIADGHISGLEIAGDGFFKERSLISAGHIIAMSPQVIMVRDQAAQEALPLEGTALGNAAELMRKKAVAVYSSGLEAGKKATASISDAMGLRREHEEADVPAPEEPEPPPA